MLPGFASISTLVNSVTIEDNGRHIRIASAGKNQIGLSGCKNDVAYAQLRIIVENRIPVHSTIGRFKKAASGKPCENGIFIIRFNRHGITSSGYIHRPLIGPAGGITATAIAALRSLVRYFALLHRFAPALPVEVRERIGALERKHIPWFRFSVYTILPGNRISIAGTPYNHPNQYIESSTYHYHGIGLKIIRPPAKVVWEQEVYY